MRNNPVHFGHLSMNRNKQTMQVVINEQAVYTIQPSIEYLIQSTVIQHYVHIQAELLNKALANAKSSALAIYSLMKEI